MQSSSLKEVWSFLTSLKLTIITLILLATTSILGTIVPQNESSQFYLRYYKPSTYKLIHILSIDDMYHSWWFTTLLALFTLNLICCSLNRLPGFFKLISNKEKELDEQLLKSLPFKKTLRIKEFGPFIAENVGNLVKKHLSFSLPPYPHADRIHLFAERGKYTRLGFYVTHLGIVFIIMGGIIGNYGYQGFMKIVEGDTSDTVMLRGSNQTKKIDFAIKCNDFEVTYYEGTQRPKLFKSNLTIIEGGREVLTKDIKVNHPLYYKGVHIYQSSYGIAAERGEVLLRVEDKWGTTDTQTHRVRIGDRFPLREPGYEVKVKRFVPDFTFASKGEVVSRSQELNNPAVQLAVFKDNSLIDEQWVFAKFPDFHASDKGDFKFTFLDFYGKEYTGLQVTKDPGVWVVWTGCILLSLGCYLVFFTSHRRLWIKAESLNGEYLVTIAGTTNKNMGAFQKACDQLYQDFKKAVKEVAYPYQE